MKVLFVLAAMMVSFPHAYALEDGPISARDAQQLYSPMSSDAEVGAKIIGGLIGGIIGAISADEADRQWRAGHGGGHNGPGHGGPGHGGPGHGGPGHGGGHHDDGITCFARDWRGNIYRAVGYNARRVQYEAVRKCERFSRYRCREAGCRIN
jgi:hypothetical protein